MKAFRTDGETRTTINIIDNARRQETEITEPGVMINQESQREFLDTLQNDIRKGGYGHMFWNTNAGYAK